MKRSFLFLVIFLLNSSLMFSQVAINIDGSMADSTAMLDVKSTNKGLLIPRMTQQQISEILIPADGLIVYCITDGNFYAFVESANVWKQIMFGSEIIPPNCPYGNSITINHVAGAVAPVTKTVTYSLVTSVPGGEPTKCWIASNLGADHQATAVNDASEASAGWYWQFNRKQGYKHNGTTRTPNTTWITSISENSNWLGANDPCALELGSVWRLPTYIEYYNIDNLGGWTDWNGPWNSALKMHAAGRLKGSDGILYSRGYLGIYWSNIQAYNGSGYFLQFDQSITCDVNSYNKEYGFSVRCLRECFVASPAEGTHIPSATQIVWNWDAVPAAIGYKWNTADDYNTAIDMGTDITYTETGLDCGSSYTRFVWAYIACGCSAPRSLTATTNWCCGAPVTITHITGNVAPVNKTVTYGTVTNIPGETSKCWITSNLGADCQATAANDATEPSAGWYWQFNLEQGYKHDGTLTPTWTITSISENSDWLAANDPCTLELGSDWRIPTYIEWSNVDAQGNWTNLNDPWNSALKLHAAGYLYENGSLGDRGAEGRYWSSIQYDNTRGYYLRIGSAGVYMGYYNKATGRSLRCLKE